MIDKSQNIDDLIVYCNRLEIIVRNQQEVINNIIDYVNDCVDIDDYGCHWNDFENKDEFLSVLENNEVQECMVKVLKKEK